MSTDPVAFVLGWLPIVLVFVTGVVLVLYSSTALLTPRRRTPSEAKSDPTLEPQRTDDRDVTSTSATTGAA